MANPRSVARAGLALFVLVWLFGPYALRSTIPIWVPFLIALGLELNFFLGAFGPAPARRPDRGPQDVDRARYGYAEEPDELLLVRVEGEELWIPYAGESEEEVEALIAEARGRPEEAPPALVAARPPRPLGNLLAGLGVIGALALALWFVESRTGWDALDSEIRAGATMRFSAEASRIAAKPVTIRCDESGRHVGAVQHTDGVAVVGGTLAYLAPERCLSLYRLASKREVSSSQTGRAIAVLAHEAWHLRGVRDEGTTECYALQSGVELGQRLGLSEGTARRLMRQQLAENVLHSGATAEYLVPRECRDGGELDLDAGTSRFP